MANISRLVRRYKPLVQADRTHLIQSALLAYLRFHLSCSFYVFSVDILTPAKRDVNHPDKLFFQLPYGIFPAFRNDHALPYAV